MKLAIFLSTAAGALAQNLVGQPACATSCLSSAINAAGCAPTDVACQCGPTKAVIAANVVGCLIVACTAASDLAQAQSAGEAACAAVSATATLTASSASGTGASSSSIVITTPVGNSTVTSVTATSGGTTNAGTTSTAGAASVARTTTRAPPSATTSRATSTTKPPSANKGSTQNGFGAGLVMALLGAVVAL
ncbi:hypothetical protein B0T14DRAFT_559938 [Immersiella caudata]|uniref:CFEM domain-containing protein n=1 Tax=Immersiella caudata TaxID=314043 RepID=A0AA40CBJ9_9PEZI|nr:hypothetical protein B0T14DRAFT_559938 [Immersiella caudata]